MGADLGREQVEGIANAGALLQQQAAERVPPCALPLLRWQLSRCEAWEAEQHAETMHTKCCPKRCAANAPGLLPPLSSYAPFLLPEKVFEVCA